MHIVNKGQLSDIIGTSERTLTEWQKEEGFPIEVQSSRGHANQYDSVKVIEWMIQRAVGGAKRESSVDRLNRVRADREELGLAQDIGELVPAEEMQQKLLRVATAIRSNFLSGNGKLKTELDTLYDTDIEISILHDHSRAILTHLAELDVESDSSDSEGAGWISPASADVLG